MNSQSKELHDLTSELEVLQLKYDSLKTVYEKEVQQKENENLLLEQLINSSVEFIEFTDETTDYQKLLQLIVSISGARYATMNIFDRDQHNYTTVAIAGIKENFERATSILGFDLATRIWEVNPILAKKLKGSTITRFTHLHELLIQIEPKSAIYQLEETFNLGEVQVIKLAKGNEEFGDFTLIFDKRETLKNGKLVELYAYQIGLFIERNRSINALRKSEARHFSMISNISDVITIIDSFGILKYLSPNVENYFGWTAEEATNYNVWDLIQAENMQELKTDFASMLESENKTETAECNIRCKDGSYKPIKLTAINLKSNPAIQGVLVNFHDISDAREAKMALKEAEWKFRALFEKGPIGVAYHKMLYDESGKPVDYIFLDANESYTELTGVDPTGKTAKEVFPGIENDNFDWIGTFGMVAKTGKKVRFEQQLESIDRWYDCVAYQYKPDHFVAAFLEISKRKRAEKKVEQTRENYETFFNTIDDFLFVLDAQGNIIHTNKTAIDRLGYQKEELIGKSVLMLHPSDRRTEAGQIVGEMLQGLTEYCPVPISTKTGIQIPVETRISRGFWDGNPVLFGVTKDITKVKLSEEKFSKLFYINPSACGLTDLHTGEYLEVNEAFYKLLEFEKNEVIGKTAIELGILTEETVRSVVSKADESGLISNIEAKLKTKNGNVKNVMLSAENIYIQDKKLRYTVAHDITENKQVEEVLRLSNEKLKAIISASPDGIGMLTVDGKIELASEKLLEMYGYSAEERQTVLGRPFLDFIDPSCQNPLKENIDRLLRGEPFEKIREYMAIKKDKSRFYVDVNSSVLFDHNNTPISVLFVERDITERKKAEVALKESEQKYKTLADSGQTLVKASGTDKSCYYFNRVWLEFTGRTHEQEVGHSWTEGLHPDDRESIISRLSEIYNLSKPFSVEYRLRRHDGEYRWIVDQGYPSYNSSGEFIGFICHCVDVTHRKQVELDLLIAKEKAEESDRLKSAFLANMSHEIRTPMNGILGFTELLKIPDLSGQKQRKYIGIIEKSGARMLNIINDIISISKVESGQMEVVMSETNVNKQIEYLYTFFKPECDQKGVHLSYQNALPDIVAIIKTDKEKVYAILTNLVKNAIKFTFEGSITFGYEKKNNFLEFFVRDTGAGIRSELKEVIFERFRQGSESITRNYEGAGLGLSISKAYVEMLGGKIWVDSKEKKGAAFYFTLPIDL